MPIIRVLSVLDVNPEKKAEFFGIVTEFFADQGVPKQAVNIVFEKVDQSNWAVGGIPLSVSLGSPKSDSSSPT